MRNKKLKKTVTIVAAILVLCLAIGLISKDEHHGKPTEETQETKSQWDTSWYRKELNEYVISTKEQLYGFAELSRETDFAGKTIKLGRDITINEGEASQWQEIEPALEWQPIKDFAGVFDGSGYTIKGMYVKAATGTVGMFANTETEAVIKNFRLRNSYFFGEAKEGIGAIAGRGSGTFERIYSDALIAGNGGNCGGLIGLANEKISMTECWYEGDITVKGNSGGLIGNFRGKEGSIQHCLNSGNINSNHRRSSGTSIGGLIGVCSGNMKLADNLSVGIVSASSNAKRLGSVCGLIKDGVLTVENTWGTKEAARVTVGFLETGEVIGTCNLRSQKQMKSYGGYQYTNLNFDEYWAVDLDGTPILRCFTSQTPEVEGLERICTADASWFDGTKEEYTILTSEELLGLSYLASEGQDFENITIKLGSNIEFNTGIADDYTNEEPLNIWIPIKQFAGTFDGQGHTISGLYATSTRGEPVGLFGTTTLTAIIRNLKITNSCFCTSEGELGGVSAVGHGVFSNIYTNVLLERQAMSDSEYGTGGIVGSVGSSVNENVNLNLNEGCDLVITNCWSDSYIRSKEQLNGGILGNAACSDKRTVKIEHCLFTGTLMLELQGARSDKASGGIVGKTGDSDSRGHYIIMDCLNAGEIIAGEKATGCGGLIGYGGGNDKVKSTVVTRSYSIREGNNDLDGVVASAKGTSLTDCDYVSREELTGENALYNTKLDFTNYWQLVPENVPILRIFNR